MSMTPNTNYFELVICITATKTQDSQILKIILCEKTRAQQILRSLYSILENLEDGINIYKQREMDTLYFQLNELKIKLSFLFN